MDDDADDDAARNERKEMKVLLRFCAG